MLRRPEPGWRYLRVTWKCTQLQFVLANLYGFAFIMQMINWALKLTKPFTKLQLACLVAKQGSEWYASDLCDVIKAAMYLKAEDDYRKGVGVFILALQYMILIIATGIISEARKPRITPSLWLVRINQWAVLSVTSLCLEIWIRWTIPDDRFCFPVWYFGVVASFQQFMFVGIMYLSRKLESGRNE